MYTRMMFIKDYLSKKMVRMVGGMLLVGAALCMVSPAASAHQDMNLSWWTNNEYHMEFLVVDYETTGVPFNMNMDQGFWFNHHCYRFYHRYFVYDGNGFHTYYYYVY